MSKRSRATYDKHNATRAWKKPKLTHNFGGANSSRVLRLRKPKRLRLRGTKAYKRVARGRKGSKLNVEITAQKREFANAPGTISKFVQRHPKPRGYARLITKLSQPEWRHQTASGNFSQGAGNQQYVADLQPLFSATDLTNIYSVSGGSLTQGNNARTLRVLVEHVYGSVTFTNASNAVTVVHVYDTMFKKKQGSGQTFVSPFVTANLAMQDEQGSVASNPINVYGMKPGDSLSYRDRCKTLGHTQIMLGPGETHKHQFFFQVNKVLNAYELQDSTSGPVNGWTRWISVIANGTPGDYNAGGANVELSPLSVYWASEYRYRWRYHYQDTSALSISNTIPNATGGTFSLIDDKTGVIEAYHAA